VTILNARLGIEGGDIAYKIIVEKCATAPWLCGDCRPECPNGAVSTAHVIDPRKCTECVGARELPNCAQVCPAGACVTDPRYRETKVQLLDKWRGLHPGEEPVAGTY
jgi:ferredoxin